MRHVDLDMREWAVRYRLFCLFVSSVLGRRTLPW